MVSGRRVIYLLRIFFEFFHISENFIIIPCFFIPANSNHYKSNNYYYSSAYGIGWKQTGYNNSRACTRKKSMIDFSFFIFPNTLSLSIVFTIFESSFISVSRCSCVNCCSFRIADIWFPIFIIISSPYLNHIWQVYILSKAIICLQYVYDNAKLLWHSPLHNALSQTVGLSEWNWNNFNFPFLTASCILFTKQFVLEKIFHSPCVPRKSSGFPRSRASPYDIK